jgi:single-strand DNA-binding protein
MADNKNNKNKSSDRDDSKGGGDGSKGGGSGKGGVGLNQVFLLGNLGADPELRETQKSHALNLRLATNESIKQGDDWVDHTEWHRAVVFGKRAEALSKILVKGSKIAVQGKLRTTKYEDKDGNEKYSTEIIADQIILCDKRSGGRDDD